MEYKKKSTLKKNLHSASLIPMITMVCCIHSVLSIEKIVKWKNCWINRRGALKLYCNPSPVSCRTQVPSKVRHMMICWSKHFVGNKETCELHILVYFSQQLRSLKFFDRRKILGEHRLQVRPWRWWAKNTWLLFHFIWKNYYQYY